MDYSSTLFEFLDVLDKINSHTEQLKLELLKDYSTGAEIQIDVPDDILNKVSELCDIVKGYSEIAYDINSTKRGN